MTRGLSQSRGVRSSLFLAFWFFGFVAMISQAFGARLEFNPRTVSVVSGQSLMLDLVVSDLRRETVGGFDVNVEYDPSILQLGEINFGLGLGNPGLLEAITESRMVSLSPTEQIINFSELSLLDESSLSLLQEDPLRLASISFQGVGIGMNTLTLRDLNFTEAPPLGIPLQVTAGSGEMLDLSSPGTAVVSVTVVPSPSAFSQVLLGLAGMCIVRWLLPSLFLNGVRHINDR